MSSDSNPEERTLVVKGNSFTARLLVSSYAAFPFLHYERNQFLQVLIRTCFL